MAGSHDSCDLDIPIMMMVADEDPEPGDVPMGHASTKESVVPVSVPKSNILPALASKSIWDYPDMKHTTGKGRCTEEDKSRTSHQRPCTGLVGETRRRPLKGRYPYGSLLLFEGEHCCIAE